MTKQRLVIETRSIACRCARRSSARTPITGQWAAGRAAGRAKETYRLGYGLGALESDAVRFEVGVDAQRREGPMVTGAENAVLGRATVQW